MALVLSEEQQLLQHTAREFVIGRSSLKRIRELREGHDRTREVSADELKLPGLQVTADAAALKAADLVDTLKGTGPFTVFAPTDAAFAKLPAGTVESLLKPENKSKLVAVLTYHVVPGAVMADQVTKLTEAKTVNGADVKVSVHDGKVMINNADVVTPDIQASNGVIHVIDAVLLPPTD